MYPFKMASFWVSNVEISGGSYENNGSEVGKGSISSPQINSQVWGRYFFMAHGDDGQRFI